MSRHSHMTREIRPLGGECPACDEMHMNRLDPDIVQLAKDVSKESVFTHAAWVGWFNEFTIATAFTYDDIKNVTHDEWQGLASFFGSGWPYNASVILNIFGLKVDHVRP